MSFNSSFLLRRIWGIPILAVIILVFGLVTTASIYSIVDEKSEALTQARFETYKSLLVTRMTNSLDGYAQVLHGAAGLFNASDFVSEEEWKHYVNSLKLDKYYPGLELMGYLSAPSEKTGSKEKYATLVYEEPTNSLSEKLFKPTSDSAAIRQEAMNAARDQNNVAVTKKLVLVQEASGEKQLGFLMLFPVYQKGAKIDSLDARRSALQGYVYSVFRSKDFLKEVTNLFDDYLEVNVYDGPKPAKKDLIYKSISHEEAEKVYSKFQEANQLLVGNHVWSIAAKPKNSTVDSFPTDNLDGILALGIIMSILLFVMTWMLIAARLRTLGSQSSRSSVAVEPITKDTKPKESLYFYAKIFHELRTPLNSIIVLSKVLFDNKDQNLNPKQVEQAGVIHQSGAELLEMIDEVMDLSRISAGKMTVNYDKIVIRDLAEEIKRTFAPQANHKSLVFNMSVDKSVPVCMYNDYRKIYQIIKNLCANALKFTKEGSIAVHFYSPDLVDALAISITDTGCGIPREKIGDIFESFDRGDEEISGKFNGSGLGLAISQEIAHVLGGEITVTSQDMRGSCFTLYLPLNTALKGGQ